MEAIELTATSLAVFGFALECVQIHRCNGLPLSDPSDSRSITPRGNFRDIELASEKSPLICTLTPRDHDLEAVSGCASVKTSFETNGLESVSVPPSEKISEKTSRRVHPITETLVDVVPYLVNLATLIMFAAGIVSTAIMRQRLSVSDSIGVYIWASTSLIAISIYLWRYQAVHTYQTFFVIGGIILAQVVSSSKGDVVQVLALFPDFTLLALAMSTVGHKIAYSMSESATSDL